MEILDKEALLDRAGELEAKGLNGMKLILVKDLDTVSETSRALLEVYFFNGINNFVTNVPAAAQALFSVTGGHRIKGGKEDGEVKAVKIAPHASDNTCLVLALEPIGDYSTYTLELTHAKIDPLFGKIDFKFRPGCFNTDCAPEWETSPEPKPAPVIDYLSKDYDSFKHTLINAMMERVPGWQATSEADLDQVLIDLFSAAADELSDYQDRVMNEAYLGTARKRISLARHARLMDYHIHQGNQASTWLALHVKDGMDYTMDKRFTVWTTTEEEIHTPGVFLSPVPEVGKEPYFHHLLNELDLFTWSDSVTALEAGSTRADLAVKANAKANAETIRDLIEEGKIKYLLIQEDRDPATGRSVGARPEKRQLLKLLPGAEVLQDPYFAAPEPEQWFVRVRWEEKDKLKYNYCFVTDHTTETVSFFCGNLLEVFHGRLSEPVFKVPGQTLAEGEYHYEFTEKGKWGTVCRLPDLESLAYRNTPPGGEVPPESTIALEVKTSGGQDPWDEVIGLIHSDDGSEKGDHFVVETDEEGRSLIRFGNGTNGRKLPEGAEVHCTYQVGKGLDGNIGADTLVYYDDAEFNKISKTWNPFDVVDGRAPEPSEEIIRRVPEAYRARQLRAVTLKDYEDCAMELDEVSQASARYAWTGSWRTVRITVDPKGTDTVDRQLKEKLARHLEAVRLIGEDIEIRPPRWIPLEILVSLCVQPQYWPEDIKFILEQEFSDGYLPDGRMGFFHPDNWTFGQSIHASQIAGRIQAVQGVDHVKNIAVNRYDKPYQKPKEMIPTASNEIIQVQNDPDHMERGIITFDIKGGRQ